MASEDTLETASEAEHLETALERARASTRAGQVEVGLEHSRQALVLARQAGNPAAEAECQMLIARAHMRRADYMHCAEHGAQALALWSRLGRPADQAEAMALSAAACGELFAHQSALALANDLTLFATQHDLPRYVPRALHIVAACYWRMGEAHEAELLMLQTLSRSREGADYIEEARAINGLLAGSAMAVDLHRRQGEPERAQATVDRIQRFMSQALACLARADFPLLKETLGLNIGIVYLQSGQFDKAEPLLEQAVNDCRALGYRAIGLAAAERLAQLRLVQGRPEDTLLLLADILAEADNPPMVGLLADALDTQARALQDLGRDEAAALARHDEHRLRQRMDHARQSAQGRLQELQQSMHATLLEFDRQALSH